MEQYLAKGGALSDTVHRQCLCNALCAGVGASQVRKDGSLGLAIVTSGDDVLRLAHFLDGRTHYSAADVITLLTSAESP